MSGNPAKVRLERLRIDLCESFFIYLSIVLRLRWCRADCQRVSRRTAPESDWGGFAYQWQRL
jgi:hypothetical protein